MTSRHWQYSLALTLALLLSGEPLSAKTDKVNAACSFEGHQLYGRIKVVSNFADVKVKVVEHFPDVKVKVVENFPDACGKWQMVSDFPDTLVQFVTNFPDVEIQYVENFPGRP